MILYMLIGIVLTLFIALRWRESVLRKDAVANAMVTVITFQRCEAIGRGAPLAWRHWSLPSHLPVRVRWPARCRTACRKAIRLER